ncbi:UDP-N-acetylglucosamine 2-epimerase [Planctomycetota bacterium]
MKRKICVCTGSRAEYGLLFCPMKEIQAEPDLQLQVAVTGMHLSPEFGLTYRIIEEDGFSIDAKVEMLMSSDSPVGIAKSIGSGVAGFADALDRLKPDILVVLGDRFEIFAAVQAALVANIPVAHIAGGDVTEGVIDESMRHGITKMSHLHFVTNEESARRVRQLGENPEHVYNFGHPGIDYINRVSLIEKEELERRLEFKFRKRNLLVTFHPLTLELGATGCHFQVLLDALAMVGDGVGVVITRPNADTGGRIINTMIDEFLASHANVKAFASLGQRGYLSVMAQVNAVVGNSSSGLYEVPSLKKPTVNIGDRQKGRLRASSVIDCDVSREAIAAAIEKAFVTDCSDTVNPYGMGDSSKKIVRVLREISDPKALLKKEFFVE